MRSILYILRQRAFFIALPLSITLLFLFPARSHAQAILLRSDPTQNAVLNSAPTQVHMWFSDDLSSSTSTAMVVTPSNKRIDLHNAHISPTDSHEMDVALQPILAPGTYSVLWTTQSADDGAVSRGSFLFSVTEPNGTVPKTNGTLPGQHNANLLDGPTFFSFIMVTFLERVRSLVSILPHYTALAITGMLILLVTGPFTATIRMNTFDQLTTTEYGRTLIVKSVLVVALLVTSAIHIGLLRPRLARDYKNYLSIVNTEQRQAITIPESDETASQPVLQESSKHLEADIERQARRLMGIQQWEPLLGIAVLICTGLLSVLVGTLQPATANQAQLSQVKAFTTMVKTSDKQFSLTLTVSPDSSGPNTFTMAVFDNHGVKATNVSVSIYATMLEMDMGTTPIKLQPDGKGNFSAPANLDMGGKWGLRVEIHTADLKFHEANVQIVAAN